MARRSAGQVYARATKDGGVSYALRFRALGSRQYVYLGHSRDGWTRDRAEGELRDTLDLVRLGRWEPPIAVEELDAQREAQRLAGVTLREFADGWWARRRRDFRPATLTLYRTLLDVHLLPFLGDVPVRDMTVARVDGYRDTRLTEGDRRAEAIAAREDRRRRLDVAKAAGQPVAGLPPVGPRVQPLGPETINKALKLLGQILDDAVERGILAVNPLRQNPRKRRAKTQRREGSFLTSAAQIAALLDAAGELDATRAYRSSGRRPLVATLLLAGPRVSEACALRWRDVDLATGVIHIADSKTDAGVRDVEILPLLRDELLTYRAALRAEPAPDAFVFVTRTGAPRDKNNARQRVLLPVVARARELLAERGGPDLPERLTPHSLRRTFASLLFALGEPPTHVKDQLGHEDAAFTLNVYAKAMKRRDGEPERLAALVRGDVLEVPEVAPIPVPRARTWARAGH